MDIAALILAIIAIVLFCLRPALTHVGLALLTAAVICQWVGLTGSSVTVH